MHSQLTLERNSISLEFYETLEIMVCGATNYFLYLKRHALGKHGVAWRALQALRKVGDTRGIEGVFSETRVGMIARCASCSASSTRCRTIGGSASSSGARRTRTPRMS